MTFDKLLATTRQMMIDKGVKFGYKPEEVEDEYNQAQRKIHGTISPWPSRQRGRKR